MIERAAGLGNSLKGRVILLIVISALAFLTYIIYLFSLQIVKGFEYQDLARRVSQRMLPIPSQRGEIFDRKGDVPIVINIDSYAVDIIPAEVPESGIESLKRELSILLSIPIDEFNRRLLPSTAKCSCEIHLGSAHDRQFGQAREEVAEYRPR